MIGQDAALGIALVALGLVLTPGPNMLYLVARALSQGRAAGFAALAGTVLGFLVYLAQAAVLHLSLLPQFIDPARGAVAAQSLILGMIQISVSVVVNAAIVLAAGALAEVVASRPRWAVVQRTVMGAALAAFGLKLLTDRPVP